MFLLAFQIDKPDNPVRPIYAHRRWPSSLNVDEVMGVKGHSLTQEVFADSYCCFDLYRFIYTGGDVAPYVDIKLNKSLTYNSVGTFKNTEYKKVLAKK